jgi:hypothetical protein
VSFAGRRGGRQPQGYAARPARRVAREWVGNVFVTPEWVALLDFQTRFPSALERAMEKASG